MFLDIVESLNWKSIDLISKGWSSDKKYKIRTNDGELLLLRVSDIDQYEASRYEDSQVRISDDETAINYVKDNINFIWRKTPVYMHGDFHPGNLIYRADGSKSKKFI